MLLSQKTVDSATASISSAFTMVVQAALLRLGYNFVDNS